MKLFTLPFRERGLYMETKKEKIVSAVATIGIILTLFGATYAYFAARGNAGKTTGVEIIANTVDVFSFETGDSISISLDQDNFASGKGNQTGETFAKATLIANNKTNTATGHYYLYLNINLNTFDYTSEDNKPEILVKITKNGTEVTSGISNLTYTSVTDANNATVTGFDITNKTGLIAIANNLEITTTSTTTDEWRFYVTFVNYDYNQADNAGNLFKAKVQIGNPLHETCDDNTLACHVAKLYTGVQGENNLYYHTTSLENGAEDNSYRYAGGNHPAYYSCTYNGAEVIDTEYEKYGFTLDGDCDTIYQIKDHNGDYSYYDKSFEDILEELEESSEEAQWNSNINICQTKNKKYLYYWDSTDYIDNEDDCQGQVYYYNYDRSYYLGIENVGAGVATLTSAETDVDNYVCFGSDEEICPDDNLYRIIGVFDGQVKLIKWDYANSDLLGTDGDYTDDYIWSSYSYRYYRGTKKTVGGYSWNKNLRNIWGESELNTINLNTNFINNIGNKWNNMIAEATWVVGGISWISIEDLNEQTVYKREIKAPNAKQIMPIYKTKIGLMYASDYLYAISPSSWASFPSDDDENPVIMSLNNWMYMGLWEWTITRSAEDYGVAIFVLSDGVLFIGEFGVGDAFAIRPTFYLNSDVIYVSGTGEKNSPIRIN